MANPNTSNSNFFFHLKYGILGDNSIVTVKDAEFMDIAVVPKGSGYTQGPSLTGRAIYGQNGTVIVNGTDFDNPHVRFDNCAVGVETENCLLNTYFTKMDRMRTGVSVLSATNRSTNITSNTIQAEAYGIKVDNVTGLPISIGFNVLRINNMIVSDPPLRGGVGIDLANSSTSNPYQMLNAYSNNISVIDGIADIRLRNNTNVWAYNNDANLTNSSLRTNFGLQLEGGDGNLLTCNRIDGSGTLGGSISLYALNTDRAAFMCNRAQNIGYGLRFDGLLTGAADAEVTANTMTNNGIGMYYGAGAITGPQAHRGNKWEGTGAVHAGGTNDAQQSPYTVDAAENPLFLPNPASDVLMVDYPGLEAAELRLFNTLGQQVATLQLAGREVRQLNLSALQSGIYWYVLRPNNQSTFSGKVLISK